MLYLPYARVIIDSGASNMKIVGNNTFPTVSITHFFGQ